MKILLINYFMDRTKSNRINKWKNIQLHKIDDIST